MVAEFAADLDDQLGPAEVLCFSPLADVRLIKPVLETAADDLMAALELQVAGAATAVGHVVAPMREARRGTLLFATGGAAIAPSRDRASSGIVYAALNAYVAMLDETLAPHGVHVSRTVIVGPVGAGERHEPAAIAEHLWQRHVQRDEPSTVIR